MSDRPFVPVVVIAFAMLVSLLLFGGGGASAAVPGTALPLTGFGDMVVDGANHHLFITGAPADGVVLVRNEDGSAAGSITGETDAGGMVLEGSTLYVARCGGQNLIDVFDTTTLTLTGSFTAHVGGTCALAEAGGRLWYSNSTDRQFGHLVSVSLDAGHTEVDSGVSLYQMRFATSPADPDWLVVTETQQSPPTVRVFDVTNPASIQQLAYGWSIGGDGLAISPDGGTLYTADLNNTYVLGAFTLPNLTEVGTYPMAGSGVAVSPNGGRIGVTGTTGNGPLGELYDTGDSTPVIDWALGASGDDAEPHGVAFNEDGSKLFALSAVPGIGSAPVLHILPGDVLPAGSVTVSRSASPIVNGKAAKVTAHLATASSNTTLSIYRKLVTGGPAVLVTTGAVNASGSLAVSVKPSADMTYWAVWAGDATHRSTTSAKVRINVRVQIHSPAQGGYATRSGIRLYHYTAKCSRAPHLGCPRFLAYASPLRPGRTLSFTLQARVSGTWRTLLTGAGVAGAGGKLHLTIFYRGSGVIDHRQRIHFSMRADAGHLGNTGPWTLFEVTR